MKYNNRTRVNKSLLKSNRRSTSKVRKGENNTCIDETVKCNILDKQLSSSLNQVWTTCINMNGIYNHILYITPKNVIIKSIETFQIPEFVVNVNGNSGSYKIMIEDKYVNCFLKICGDWYAMMRLFGKTINTSYLARTEKNRAFYKLKNIGDLLPTEFTNNDALRLPNGYYKIEDSPRTFFSFATSSAQTIKIKDSHVENINKRTSVKNKPVFKVLQRFRQQKLLGNDAKQEAAEGALDVVF